MVASSVEAVWVWYYGGVNQKWTYGRFVGDGFTKDHLQINATASEIVTAVYGLEPGAGLTQNLTLRWPGGEVEGSIRWSAGRFTLRWIRDADVQEPWSSPAPWRLTPDPNEFSSGPLKGNGKANSVQGAIAAIEAFNAADTRAYLVAVKLQGERDVLHLRTYIDEPEDDLDFASTGLLPGVVRALVDELGSKPSCVALKVDGVPADNDVLEIIRKLEKNPNLLLIGPPGTGKSVLLDKLAQHVENPGANVTFDPTERYDAWGESVGTQAPGKALTVVFHPSYSYDNLVVGLLPKPQGNTVSVGAVTGPLVNLAHYASSGNRALLVLDEFNRGNSAAILGDTLALLDSDKRGSAHIELPSYGLPLEVPHEYAVEGDQKVSSRLTLPKNLWIVAAMNSSDRSVAPLDAALRRRFSIIEIAPDYKLLSSHLVANDNADLSAIWDDWTLGTVAKLSVALLKALNSRIEAALGRDFTLGHSNFWQVGGATPEEALRSLAGAWDQRIVQTLRLALQDDDDTLAFILNAGKSRDASSDAPDRAVWWKKADSAFDQFPRPRIQFNDLVSFTTPVLLSELKRLAGA